MSASPRLCITAADKAYFQLSESMPQTIPPAVSADKAVNPTPVVGLSTPFQAAANLATGIDEREERPPLPP